MKMLLVILGTACLSPSIFAQETLPQREGKADYLVIYRPGPGWLAGKPVSEQPLKEHGKYMLSLYIKGSMKMAGPLGENAGGAVLLTVADESEARAIVAEDPAVKSGIFVYEMHSWQLQPWDEFAKKAKTSTHSVTPLPHPSTSPR